MTDTRSYFLALGKISLAKPISCSDSLGLVLVRLLQHLTRETSRCSAQRSALRSNSMNVRLTHKILLAVACSLVLALLPVSSALGQDIWDATKKGVHKGAEGVKKGTETVVDKTKEGAKAVGKGAKDLVTDDDKDKNKNTDTYQYRMKPGQTQTQTQTRTGTAGSSETTSSSYTRTGTSKTGEHNLPKTAGELPLLALGGALALVGAGALRMARRAPKIH